MRVLDSVGCSSGDVNVTVLAPAGIFTFFLYIFIYLFILKLPVVVLERDVVLPKCVGILGSVSLSATGGSDSFRFSATVCTFTHFTCDYD